ncbi:hypothetical protein [Selenomonas infelix]|nr:hypothetical protein [Selenomonas infelix]
MPLFHPWVGALRAFGALESGMKEKELTFRIIHAESEIVKEI